MAPTSNGLRLRGQSEPLTRRLKRLLDEYSDGLAVPKELLQNADDAGATEVALVYDCRENTGWRSSETLLDPAMADCQGRTLWAFNNATFSDEDFDNILQLSGATKLEKTAKVGRFGLGFNSVYNLTDVPHILSRHRMLILDPHGERRGEGYLEAVYAGQGERDTGVELDFRAQPELLDQYANQLAPFAGVLGCNLHASGGDFNGTLLRLPLRNDAQAAKSKVCDRVYSNEEILSLLRLAAEQADTMLLFTQTVRTFRVLFLPSNAINPSTDTQLVFSIHKKPLNYFQRHSIKLQPLPFASMTQADQEFAAQSSTLKVAEALIQSSSQNEKMQAKETRFQATIEVEIKLGDSARDHFQISAQDSTRTWLVCTAVGSGQSLKVAMEQRQLGLAPVGAVALPIDQFATLKPLSRDTEPASLLFCFLPLPVENPFPMMLNANFSVTSSRRHLNEVTVDEKQGVWSLGQWNRALLTDVICAAYIDVLKIVSRMKLANAEIAQELWPRFDNTTLSVWRPLIESFYDVVLESDKPVFYTSAGWKSLRHTVFIDPIVMSLGKISDCFKRLATRLVGENEGVALLTDGVRRTIEQLQKSQKIQQRTWSGETLLQKFVANMSHLRQSGYSEDCFEAIKFILEAVSPYGQNDWSSVSKVVTQNVKNSVMQYCCIPNVGSVLCMPSQLLDPGCTAARLFESNASVFPHSDLATPQRLAALRSIGIRVDLTWNEVLNRAQSVSQLSDPIRYERIVILLSYLDSFVSRFNQPLGQLQSIPFLPAMRRPENSCLVWRADQFDNMQLFLPTQLFHSSCKDLNCDSQLILDDSVLRDVSPSTRSTFLEELGVLGRHDVTPDMLLNRLASLASINIGNDETLRVSRCVYQRLSELVSSAAVSQQTVTSFVCRTPNIIWTPDGFIQPGQVSRNRSDPEFQPFLCVISREISASQYAPFLNAAGVNPSFKASHYSGVLNHLTQKYQSKPLDPQDLQLSLRLLEQIGVRHDKALTIGNIFAPDSDGILRPCNQLCFNNLPWMKSVSLPNDIYFCHPDISFGLCTKLGIRSQRESILSQAMQPLPFGQHEDLTTRLQNIISGYPLGIELFKELIQNADDAGASKICFILDRRSHGTEKVLSDNWKELQGPALLVYNDSVFSEADIKGIQSLGLGSKRDDAWKAGQYGIGFNCVYNITDAPSFLSDDEVFCVMDPHCRYMPGATFASPGGMYKDLQHLKEVFHDVFAGFLPQYLPHKGGTVFRLPLRTPNFASKSKICEKAVSPEEIKDLFDAFEPEIDRIALFLLNLREVELSEVLPNGEIQKLFHASLEAKNICGRFDYFKSQCQSASQQLQNGGVQLSQLAVSSVTYELTINCAGTRIESESSWLVVQKLGGPIRSVPTELAQQVASGKWRLLPNSGVAAAVSRISGFKGHIFCLLPLPVTTGLPIHVNGHFIMDPSRRSLWKADGVADFKEQWNRFLATQLIPDCYGSLLETAKAYFSKTDKLQEFYGLLPECHYGNQSIWKELAKIFFQNAFKHRWAIFPVLQGEDRQLTWLPLALNADDVDGSAAFLTPQNVTNCLKSTLRKLRFPLLVPDQVGLLQSLQSSKIEFIPMADSFSILSFLRGLACEPLRDSLPMEVNHTVLENSETVVALLSYLVKVLRNQLHKLQGAPLNLNSGNRLALFGSGDPLFLSEFYDIFEHCEGKHAFAHPETFFAFSPQEKDNLEAEGLFSYFLLDNFHTLLFKMQANIYRTDILYLDSSELTIGGTGFGQWLRRTWKFFSTQCSNPEELLLYSELSKAHLIPIKDSLLCSIAMAPCVYEPLQDSLDDCSNAFQESLKQLNAPSLSMTDLKLVGSLCGNVRKPESMLRVIEFALNEKPERSVINEMQAVSFLLYIQSYWNQLSRTLGKQNVLDRVRRLPVFVTSDGQCCALNSQQACILPHSLVADEMNAWKSSSNAIFLKDNVEVRPLYSKLKCDEMEETEVYASFILPVFSKFTDQTKRKHLERLSDLSWSFDRIKTQQSDLFQKLSYSLKTAKLIPHQGKWCRVDAFFDHTVEIFQVLLQSECFLPAPYNEETFKTLMKYSGLVRKCTAEIVLKFAKQLSAEGLISITEEVITKTEFLLKYIDSGKFEKHRTEGIVRQLAKVPFVVANSDERLGYLCQSDSVIMTSLSQCALFEDRFICWTVMPYAPSCVGRRSCFANAMPSVSNELFLRHVSNIFSTPAFTSPDLQGEVENLRAVVMSSVYTRLSEILNSGMGNLVQFLKDIPCVLIKTGNGRSSFVSACRITHDENSAILPYIQACPSNLTSFRRLFLHLGATETATLKQLRLALELIRDEQKDVLSEEQCKSVSHCLSSIIVLLERGGTLHFQPNKILFLSKRSQKKAEKRESPVGGSFELVDCRSLTINDAEADNQRLLDAPGVQFLDLSFCKLGTDKLRRLYFHLAADMGLKKLSDNVSEELVSDIHKECDDVENCEARQLVQAKLSHPVLHQCIVSIMLHGNQDHSIKGDEKLTSVTSLISRFSVVCLSELRTCLLLNGVKQPESEEDKNFFLNQERILMNHSTIPDSNTSADKKQFWLMDFADVVLTILGNGFNLSPQQTANLHQVLLMDDPMSMPDVLTRLKITLHQTCEQQFEEPSFIADSTLGEPVPEFEHCLLKQLPAKPRSMLNKVVAYKKPDGELVFAQVLERDPGSGSDNQWTSEFIISIGKGSRIKVQMSELYLIEEQCTSQNIDSSNNSETLETTVDGLLSSAATLPTQQQRQIFQRILAHYSDNSGNFDQVRRIAENHGWTRQFDGCIGEWREQTIRMIRYRQIIVAEEVVETMRTGSYRYGSSSRQVRSGIGRATGIFNGFSPAKSARTPTCGSPDDAERYLKTARHDLRSAARLAEAGEFNWACYLCWQAAEKALKALLMKQGQPVERCHQLSQHLCCISGSDLQRSLADHVTDLARALVDDCRYPSDRSRPRVPSEVFGADQAERALQGAEGAERCVSAAFAE